MSAAQVPDYGNFVDTSDADFVSRPLKLSFTVGSTGIIHGIKCPHPFRSFLNPL